MWNVVKRSAFTQSWIVRFDAHKHIFGFVHCHGFGRFGRCRLRSLAAAIDVADLARGWLAEAGFRVDDPDGYAERMTAAQRTALRTTVASLPLADFERPGVASVRGQDRDAVLELALPVAARPRRTRVAPLVPLLRSAFGRADVRIDDDRVLVRVELAVPR